MSSHLEGPWLSTTYTKERKQKMTKYQQEQHEQLWRDRNDRLKAMGLPKQTFEQYLKWAFGRGEVAPRKPTGGTYTPPKVVRRETTHYPSIPDTVTGAITVKKTPEYTGDKMIGISTLHKSNAVPVFTQEEAIDIAKMRR